VLLFRVEISIKDGFPDPRGEALQKDIRDLGITTIKQVRVSDIYLLEGSLGENEVESICRELLAESIFQEYSYNRFNEVFPPPGSHLIEVAYNPGVIDPVEESVIKGIRDLYITTVESVKTAKKYLLWGQLSDEAF
jgi:phosphoribosylformylglycinamidine synthase